MPISTVKINQVGFPCHAPKRFVLPADCDCGTAFAIEKIFLSDEGGVEKRSYVAYQGTLTETFEGAMEGRFDDLTEAGDYRIRCGKYQSRPFAVNDNVYSHTERVLLSYFTYQRCGDPLGWAGSCHTEDGIIAETGERVDLTGGYHQSCDLRKSPGGIPIGVYAMTRAAMLDSSEWGKILYPAELRHACDYFVKTIQPCGAMYNTLNAPFGWGGRIFYQSPAPASGQWNVTRTLALAAKFVPDRAEVYLDTAKRSWDWLISEERPSGRYRHPAPTPRGMDQEGFFSCIYKNSVADRAYRVCCAADFYRATGDGKWLEEVRKAEEIEVLAMLTTVQNRATYGWAVGGLNAYADAWELCGLCRDKIEKCAEILSLHTADNLWCTPSFIYTSEQLEEPAARHGYKVKPITVRENLPNIAPLEDYEGYWYTRSVKFSPSGGGEVARLLLLAGKILGRKDYITTAQRLAYAFLGGNAMDASHVESIGYNQPVHGVYGQFFPATPQIPGGVTIGFDGNGIYTSEYDMPCVGQLMWLLAELERAEK